MTWMPKKGMGVLLALSIASGCNPKVKDAAALRSANFDKEWDQLYSNVHVPTHALTLQEVVDIAQKQNLELLVKEQEEAIQQEITTAEKLRYLPTLSITGNISGRNTEPGALAKSLLTGLINDAGSQSQEKQQQVWDFELAWSLLDFGITYFNVRQEKNREQMARARTTRMRQNLTLKVVQAYWKAVISMQAKKTAETLMETSRSRQETIDDLLATQSLAPIEGLRNKDTLMETQIRLNDYKINHQNAIAELAELMGLPPGSEIKLADVKMEPLLLPKVDITQLSRTALKNRPELTEQDYQEEIHLDEARKHIIAALPNPTAYIKQTWDANDFLVNQQWLTVGYRQVWQLLSIPRQWQLHNTENERKELVKRTRLSVSAAILTQVHLAYMKLYQSVARYELANEAYRTKQSLLKTLQKQTEYGLADRTESHRMEVQAFYSQVNALGAYADFLVALEELGNAVGKPLTWTDMVASTDSKESSPL